MWVAPALSGRAGVGPAAKLGFVVMVVMGGVMMVMRLSECRRRNQHQEQGCEDDLFHGLRVAPGEPPRSVVLWRTGERVSRTQTGRAGLRQPNHVATGGWDSRQMNEA
jgi:hypothetical protein